jgi:hypothetical protein
MNEIIFKGLRVQHIVQRGLKNCSLRITRTEEPQIILKTPKVTASFISELLNKKERWIFKQLQKIEQTKKEPLNLQDEVELFAERVSIDAVVSLRTSLEKINPEDEIKVLKAYDAFYKEVAQSYLSQRLEYFAKIMGLKYNEIKFKKMRSRWGSCSSCRVITLNTQLVKVDKKLIDYVLVHELAHLVHMNHSKAFHALVSMYLPDAYMLRKKLKEMHLD